MVNTVLFTLSSEEPKTPECFFSWPTGAKRKTVSENSLELEKPTSEFVVAEDDSRENIVTIRCKLHLYSIISIDLVAADFLFFKVEHNCVSPQTVNSVQNSNEVT